MTDDRTTMRWWVTSVEQDDAGDYDVHVQFADGSALRLIVVSQPGVDLAGAIADGVAARLRGDRRWTPKSERGG